jgi:ATP adenylyltransferase
MKRIYTPWRLNYLRGEKQNRPVECIFCAKHQAGNDAAEHIIYRSEHVYVTLNRYPYNNGHLMIIPYAHVATLEEMPAEALADLMATTNRALKALRKTYNPAGFNLGANLGEAAGAGVAGHFHFHIVPRWAADINFMTAVGETRVIPDTLDQTYSRLKEVWE